jgi:hypothetical protein
MILRSLLRLHVVYREANSTANTESEIFSEILLVKGLFNEVKCWNYTALAVDENGMNIEYF